MLLLEEASLLRTLMLHKPVDAVNPLLLRCEIMYTDNRKDTKSIVVDNMSDYMLIFLSDRITLNIRTKYIP